MSVPIVTGSSGLIGSETANSLHEKGMVVIGIGNDMRSHSFGHDAPPREHNLFRKSLKKFHHHPMDIRNVKKMESVFAQLGRDISLVVHTPAQPSHDGAAREPLTDFTKGL